MEGQRRGLLLGDVVGPVKALMRLFMVKNILAKLICRKKKKEWKGLEDWILIEPEIDEIR